MLKKLLVALAGDHGVMTIAELLVVCTLLLLSMDGIYRLSYFVERNWISTKESTEAQQQGRFAIDQMVKEIREAEDENLDGDLSDICFCEENRFVFFADIDNDAVPERIRYEVNSNDELVMGIREPSSSEPPWQYYGVDTESVLAKYVRNDNEDPVFTYYDSVSSELSYDADMEEVRIIRVKLTVDVKVGQSPPAFEIDSSVKLRNFKDE